MIEATAKPGPCQVRSKTESPCPRRAVVEIRGVPFCEACAREQVAYFAIGELTREKRGLRGNPLAEALNGMRRERRGGGVTKGRSGVTCIDETERLEPTMS